MVLYILHFYMIKYLLNINKKMVIYIIKILQSDKNLSMYIAIYLYCYLFRIVCENNIYFVIINKI